MEEKEVKNARLYDEILFTRQLLGIGLTYLRKASFVNKGVYFQAFSNLSLGIERLCKICLIVNYLKCNNEYPDTTSIRCFGHNLEKLVKHISDDIASNIELSYEFEFLDIHKMIIRHLSNFASSSAQGDIVI